MTSYYHSPNILFCACWKNQIEIIKECIRNSYDINKQNFWFETPLMFASHFNNLDAVKILVENGADLNIIDLNGSTALGYAKHKSEVQQYLKNKGAIFLKCNTDAMSDLKMEIQSKDSVSPTTQETINKIDSWGFSPFMWTIWHQSHDHFEIYLALGADINQKYRNGTTPLMLACYRKNFIIVQQLIEKGALVNEIDDNGNSALMYCTTWLLSTQIADLLICKGAYINRSEVNSSTPLISATISGDLSALKYFLNKKVNVNAIDNTGNTAIAYVSYFGTINTAKILIENKAELDLSGPNGKTPLSWAVTANKLGMVKFLLKNGAKINQKDQYNNTALSYAIQYGYSEIIKHLEKAQETNLLICSAIQ